MYIRYTPGAVSCAVRAPPHCNFSLADKEHQCAHMHPLIISWHYAKQLIYVGLHLQLAPLLAQQFHFVHMNAAETAWHVLCCRPKVYSFANATPTLTCSDSCAADLAAADNQQLPALLRTGLGTYRDAATRLLRICCTS
jgi:hypothetical protein